MRFQSSTAFEKHLTESFPNHLSHLYLFVSPCDYEKRLWIEHLVGVLKKKEAELTVKQIDAKEVPFSSIQEEVRAPNLWGGLRVIWIDHIDQVKPLAPFLALCTSSMGDVVLIFTAASNKALSDFYQQGKKELVVLDVSEEKPWDKEKRLQQWLGQEAIKQGKKLSSPMAAELVKQLGSDVSILHTELYKLMTYVGERASLQASDIAAICGGRDLMTSWQLAETVIWKHPIPLHDKIKDLNFLFPFIGQLRYQLQLGAELSELMERKIPLSELKKHFPSLRPALLDKLAALATGKGSSFFLRGLLNLYDFELSAKSSSIDVSIVFDIFQVKTHAKTDSSS